MEVHLVPILGRWRNDHGSKMFCRDALALDYKPHSEKLSNISIDCTPTAGIQDSLVDVLSEVLRVVRLSGAIHFCAEFTRAFQTSPPSMLAARLKLPEGSVTPFHVVTAGSCLVTSGTLPPIHIETGDVIVFPRGDQHIMASDPELAPVPIHEIYSQPSKEQIAVVIRRQRPAGTFHLRFSALGSAI
jgi:hypothetical protein